MSHFLGRSNGWHFDIPTLIVTLLFVPLATYFLGILRKHGKTWGGFLFEGACYWVGRVVMHSLAARFTLKRYCRLELQKENKYLYVPSSTDVKLEIDRVFVNLTLEQQSTQTESYDQSTLFTAGNRIRVIGDPGSGKSSLVKRLFRDACLAATASPSKAKLPVLVELKNISIPNTIASKKLGRWLYDELKRSAARSAVYGMEDCFDNYARVSGLLVLLDGLDEVASAGYARVQDSIVGLSELLSNFSDRNTLILTMRTQLHQQIKDAFRSSFGKAVFVKPFSPTDIYEFLSRWPFTDRRVGPSIYAELTDRPTLREMCTNPLVLAMYVAERQSGSDPLTPESRTDFYRRVLDELLVKRRLRQTGPAPLPGKLREQRERILGRVAYEHLLDANQAAHSLHWAEAMRVVREVMKCGDQEAEDIFLAIAKDTGLVSQEKERETFRFIHLTFCEFLAAHEAVQGQKNGVDRLIDMHRAFRKDPTTRGPSRLIEVIPFACGLVQRLLRDDAISKVSALGDDRLLARCFLETKNYEHAAWQTFAESTRDSLMKTAESSWNEQWLQDLHLFNVVVRDAAQCSKYVPITGGQIDLGEFYEQLVRKQGGNSLPRLLAAYASHDAPAALRLAEISGLNLPVDFPEVVIDNCGQIPFLSLVVDKVLSGSERSLAWAVPLAEAGLGSRLVAGFLGSKAADRGAVDELLKSVPCLGSA